MTDILGNESISVKKSTAVDFQSCDNQQRQYCGILIMCMYSLICYNCSINDTIVMV